MGQEERRRKKIADFEAIGKWEDTGGHKWGLDHWGTDDNISDWKPDFGGGNANDYGDQPEDEGGDVWFPLWAPFMTSGYGLGSDPMGDQYTTIVGVTATTTGDETTVDVTTTVYDSEGNPVAQDSASYPVGDGSDGTAGTSDGTGSQGNESPSDSEGIGFDEPSDTIEVDGESELPGWIPGSSSGRNDDTYAGRDDEEEPPLTVVVEGGSSTWVKDDVYSGKDSSDVDPKDVPSDEEWATDVKTVIVVGNNWPDLLVSLWWNQVKNNVKEHLHITGAWDVTTIYVYANPETPKNILKLLNENYLAPPDDLGHTPRNNTHWQECEQTLNDLSNVGFTIDPAELAFLAELWDEAELECHSYMPIWNAYNPHSSHP